MANNPTLPPSPSSSSAPAMPATTTTTTTTTTSSTEMTLENETESKNDQAGPPAVGKGSTSEQGPTDDLQYLKTVDNSKCHTNLQQTTVVDMSVKSQLSTESMIPRSKKLTAREEEVVEQLANLPNNRPVVPPVTNLPSGVVLPTTPLQPQQLNCSIPAHKISAMTAASRNTNQQQQQLQKQQQLQRQQQQQKQQLQQQLQQQQQQKQQQQQQLQLQQKQQQQQLLQQQQQQQKLQQQQQLQQQKQQQQHQQPQQQLQQQKQHQQQKQLTQPTFPTTPTKIVTQPQQPVFTSTVSPTTIQAMLASVKPVVPMSAMCSGRSTLRNYRRPKSRQQCDPVKADTTNGNKSFQNVIGSRALPSDISVTPVVNKVTDGQEVKRPIEHQPPSVSCYPVNKEVEVGTSPEVIQEKQQSTPMSIEDLVAAKKLKDEQTSAQSPSQQNSRAFQIPKGLTITEISAATKSDVVAVADNKVQITPAIFDVQALPVLHIPEVSTGDHYDLLQKFDEASMPSVKKSIAPIKTNGGAPGGHPGMPNGLLRMTASLHQKSDFSRPGIGKIVTTKVTPKDLKSQMALNKIGLSMNNGNSFQSVTQQVI